LDALYQHAIPTQNDALQMAPVCLCDLTQWSVAVTPGEAGGQRSLRLAHVRTLRMADDVLCCRISPDGKLLAVALLDATIKVIVGAKL